MEEDLNENDLEERLYAMLHHVDETQANDQIKDSQDDALRFVENAPRSTMRRYWRIGDENSYQKINVPKPTPTIKNTQQPTDSPPPKQNNPKPKQNLKTSVDHQSADLSIFQSPVPTKKTIEIIEDDITPVVELESSDEDEVIEIALPPKPTITIESSDDEELPLAEKQHSPAKESLPAKPDQREVSASPVPSIVSSVSDEFIRSDCIALKISSKRPDDHSFDFSLHGSDLIETPRKKKKKKSKDKVTSTPLPSGTPEKLIPTNEECFATPKSKVKNKKQHKKSYSVSETSLPNPDVYDSDSNQSTDINRTKSYLVTEKSLPNTDVYESDSSQPEIGKESNEIITDSIHSANESFDNSISTTGKSHSETLNSTNKNDSNLNDTRNPNVILDLTNNNDETIIIDERGIDENIVIGNVTGFRESEDYDEVTPPKDISKLGSTNVPAILNEDLDFDNLKGTDNIYKRRKYSLTALRAEMEKFYNESWGGENFNHREIQKNMSRDKSLWAIDPKDRMPTQYKKKVTCNYCNRPGHRDDNCRMKPPICYMCGSMGHYEPRCPKKICLNCGSPSYMYSTMCRNCAPWNRMQCCECGQLGHPSSHCPDLWRRYHNTVDFDSRLEENRQMKKHYQLFCSGCTRRGHLVHTCRHSIPFSGLPINSPYVAVYRPAYFADNTSKPDAGFGSQQNNELLTHYPHQGAISSATPFRNERNKRQSKSPVIHENHMSKKRNLSMSDAYDDQSNLRNQNDNNKSFNELLMQRKISISKDSTLESSKKAVNEINSDSNKAFNAEKAPDFIPLLNVEKQDQAVIQDNEVSDTSNVVTSSRMYVVNGVIEKLKTTEGVKWLEDMTNKHHITVDYSESNLFVCLKGKIADQEAFQSDLREWTNDKMDKELSQENNKQKIVKNNDNNVQQNIPKNKSSVLRVLSKALESLKEDLGDPNILYKELTYLRSNHAQLLKRRVISPKKLLNNRQNINGMLKKLNMILLGQAGLANGSQHLSELYNLLEQVTKCRQNKIATGLRQKIGEHYHCIFAALPRNDYVELLEKYHMFNNKQNNGTPRKIKNKEDIGNAAAKNNNDSPNQTNNQSKRTLKRRLGKGINQFGGIRYVNNCNGKPNQEYREPLRETMNKLLFYHRRIFHTRPMGTVLKKTKNELVRKLHTFISSLGQQRNVNSNVHVSSKNMKKINKVQEQAQLFLTSI